MDGWMQSYSLIKINMKQIYNVRYYGCIRSLMTAVLGEGFSLKLTP